MVVVQLQSAGAHRLVVAGLLTFKDCQVMLVGAAVRCLVVQLVIEKASLAFAQQPHARSELARLPTPGSKNCRRIWEAGSVRKVQDFPAAAPGPSHFLPDTEMSALREH